MENVRKIPPFLPDIFDFPGISIYNKNNVFPGKTILQRGFDLKFSRFFSGLFLSLALILMALAILMSMALPGTKPTLVGTAQEAQNQVVAAMDALCQGDFSGAEQYLLGQPSLGADREPKDPAGGLIWDAFLDSLAYQLSGNCYATDTGVAQDISLTYLDISSVTANLAQRSEKHLTRLQQEATHTSQIYDESGNYRQDVVLGVLHTVVQEALQEDAQYISCTISLQLVCRDGTWYIVPNSDFIHAISGGM